MRTGILLAGGASTRFGGTPKGLTRFQGTPVVTRVADALLGAADEVLVVLSPDAPEAPWRDALAGRPVRLARDPRPHEGPGAALLPALPASGVVLVAPSDTPLLTADVLHLLLGELERDAACDAAVPRVGGVAQPLVAAYRPERLRAALEAAAREGRTGVRDALPNLQVRWVDETALRAVDPDLRALRAFNTPGELAALGGDAPDPKA